MKRTYILINYEWLENSTGDPFVDAGGYALKEYSNQFPNSDILELIMKVTDIYVDRWNAGLHMFYLNSTITQPNFKTTKKKKEETKKYFEGLLNETISHEDGYCRILGVKTKLFKAGRDNSILTGSSSFLNFHHNMEEGLLFSKEVLIRLFFTPLASVLIHDKMSIITCNQETISEYFAKKQVIQNLKNINFPFTLRSRYLNIPNALFAFIDDVMTNVKIAKENNQKVSLTLYHFTNSGATPSIDIYRLPLSVFNFYRYCTQAVFAKQWGMFVNSNYKKYMDHKVNYNINDSVYTEKFKDIILIEKSYFERLQNDESLKMNLLQFGNRKDNKCRNCYIIDPFEYNNWKTKNIYKKWNNRQNKQQKEQQKKLISKEEGGFELKYTIEKVKYKWINCIYDNLLANKSINCFFLNWLDPAKYNQSLDLKIIRYYQINIQNMNTKTLELIEKLSDFIIDNNDNLEKAISKIKIGKSYELRSFLIKQIERNYNKGNESPLLTMRDYVNYLFPDGSNWSEIRDLFLICIYQKLHEKDIKVKIEDLESSEIESDEHE